MAESTKVSLLTATCVVAGSMIGTGVFVSLGYQLAGLESGFTIMVLWVLGGLLALCGATCYAELAAALPRSGGEYHLLSESIHPLAGFLSGWISATAGFAAPVAVSAMAFATYLSKALPGLNPMALSMLLVLGVTAIHLGRLEIGSRFLGTFTLLKIALIIVLACAAFLLAPAQEVSFVPATGDLGQVFSSSFAVSLMWVMYSYAGWNGATYIVNEIEDPQRNVPRALLIGTAVVTVLYVGVNAAFLYSTPAEALKGNKEVGLIAGEAIFGPTGGAVMGVLIALGLISSVSALIWQGPRVAQMMGEDYRILSRLGRTTRQGIPRNAILLQSAITLVLLAFGTFESVLIYIQFTIGLSAFLTVLGVIVLRIRRPGLERPYRAWGYPLTPLLFLVITGYSMWMVMFGKDGRPKESLLGLTTLLIGAALFGFGKWRETKDQ